MNTFVLIFLVKQWIGRRKQIFLSKATFFLDSFEEKNPSTRWYWHISWHIFTKLACNLYDCEPALTDSICKLLWMQNRKSNWIWLWKWNNKLYHKVNIYVCLLISPTHTMIYKFSTDKSFAWHTSQTVWRQQQGESICFLDYEAALRF